MPPISSPLLFLLVSELCQFRRAKSVTSAVILLIVPSTDSSLTTFAQISLVRWTLLRPAVFLRLHLNTCPPSEPECDPLYVRIFVKRQHAEPVAGSTSLVEDLSVVPVPWVSPYQDGYFLAAPDAGRTGIAPAPELAHDICRVFLVGAPIGAPAAVLPLEPGSRADFVGEGVDDALVESGEHGVGFCNVLVLVLA